MSDELKQWIIGKRLKAILNMSVGKRISVRSFPLAMEVVGAEDRLMVDGEGVSAGRRVRRWQSIAEKRQIVQLTMAPGASVAEVARAHGVNANQVFKWRRAFERGDLIEPCAALIPVTISSGTEAANGAAEAA